MSLFDPERRRRALAAEAAQKAQEILTQKERASRPPLSREQAAVLIQQAKYLLELKDILHAMGENSVKTEEELAPYNLEQRENFTGRVQALAIEMVMNTWLPLMKQKIEEKVITEGREVVRRYYAMPVNTQIWRNELRLNYGTSSALGIHAKVIEIVEPILEQYIAHAVAKK